MTFHAFHQAPKYEQLAEVIRGRVDAGDYPPGNPLPSETTIAEEFGVSRVTVNRALQLLRTGGVITVVRGVHTLVADPGRLTLDPTIPPESPDRYEAHTYTPPPPVAALLGVGTVDHHRLIYDGRATRMTDLYTPPTGEDPPTYPDPQAWVVARSRIEVTCRAASAAERVAMGLTVAATVLEVTTLAADPWRSDFAVRAVRVDALPAAAWNVRVSS